MPFSLLMTDTVDLLKKDGSKAEGLKASIQKNKIFMDAGKLLIESGDLILRRMSTGAQETYEVVDPGFYERFGSIPANYQIQMKKLGAPEATRAVQHITYNITGHNARINQSSTDNSTNVVNIDARAIQYIAALRSEIESLNLPAAEKQAALELVQEVEGQIKAGKSKKAVVSALLGALPHVASITSIVASLVALL